MTTPPPIHPKDATRAAQAAFVVGLMWGFYMAEKIVPATAPMSHFLSVTAFFAAILPAGIMMIVRGYNRKI